MTTVVSVAQGGTGANSAALARTALGVPPSAAYDQANTARAQANTAYGQANNSYSSANLAYAQANTAYGQANSAYSQANSAYGAANTRLSASGGTVSGDLIITGNLTVSGNSTTLNTEVLTVEDAEVVLLSNVASTPALNAGVIVNRGTSTNTFLRWNESIDEWGWSDNGTTTYYFDDLRAGLATTNTTFGTINTSLGTINTSYQAAYAQANTAGTNALNAYGQANAARTQANSGVTIAGNAYGAANSAATNALNAYGQANTARTTANSAYGQANSGVTIAGNAYGAANNRVLKSGDTMTGSLTLGAGRTVGAGGAVLSSTGLNTDVLANGRTAGVSTGWGTFRIHQEAGNPGLIIAGDASQTAPYMRIQNNAESALLVFSASGNLGVGAASPSAKLHIQNTNIGTAPVAAFYQYSGTAGSPTEVADWPYPVLSLRSYGNFYRQTMLSFGLPNDADYKTDESVWCFRLNGVTASGWDNNSNTTPSIASSSDLGLELLGPGNLRLGTVGAKSILFRTNNTDKVAINSDGNVGIGTSSPGSRLTIGTSFANTVGITVDSAGASDGQLILRKGASNTAFGVLAWDSQVYLSAGIYYDNGWVHQNNDDNNLLFTLDPGGGARWYASNNSSGSWNVSSNIQLWDDSANWTSLVQSTRTGNSYFTGGNVGIGTTSPASLLDVNGSVRIATNLTFAGSPTTILKPSNARLDIGNIGGLDSGSPFWLGYHWSPPDTIVNSSAQNSFPRTSFYFNYNQANNPSNMAWNMYTGNNNGVPISWNVGTETAGAFNIITSGSTRLTIDSVGRAMFNTTSANTNTTVTAKGFSSNTNASVLEVLDSNNILRSFISDRGAQNWYIMAADGLEKGSIRYGTPGGFVGILYFDTQGTTRSDFRHLSGGGFTWNAHALGTPPPELMRMDVNGNFAIGTTTMSGKFNVNGGRSYFYSGSDQYGIGVTYNSSTSGFFLGADSNGDFCVSDWGGSTLLKVTTRTGAIAGGTAGDSVGFSHAGIWIDRTWSDYPGISVMNANAAGNGQQGQFRFHGTNASFNSYPGTSGGDFSVQIWSDGGFYDASDRRFKTNITTIPNALSKVLSMTGRRFQFINNIGNIEENHTQNGFRFGFVAQELQEAGIDEVYKHHPDDDDGTDGYNKAYSVHYGSVTALLVEAIKDLKSELDAATSRIAQLENK